jgi:uncharacterized protein (DUF2164 family)
MNYYILPKNNLKIDIFLFLNSDQVKPFISYSLIYHLNDIYANLLKLEYQFDSEKKFISETTHTTSVSLDYINKIVNPFEFIHTNVPGTILSVSKVKPESSLFFDLMEIFQICNITEFLSEISKINIANFTPNFTSTNYLLNMLREDNEDVTINEFFNFGNLCEKYVKNTVAIKIDLMIFEFKDEDYIDVKQYIKNVLLTFYIIVKYQANNGTCIIKFDNIFYKVIIDVILMLTSIYRKVYLIKPSISKITKGERYIICSEIDYDLLNRTNLFQQLEEKLKDYLLFETTTAIKSVYIHSFLKNEVPYYFLNKIEESNAVIGQQQLESYDQIINIFKNKNKEDKIESLKRNHIQKCIQWCEKNQIPHNKFTDKINIFLNTKREESLKYLEESIFF